MMDNRSIDLIVKTAQKTIRFREEGLYRLNDGLFLNDVNADLGFLGFVVKAPADEILLVYGSYVCPLGKC
jgi:hypothetical protein